MFATKIGLMVVGVLVFVSEIVDSGVPKFCAVAPVPGFAGSSFKKWGFYPEENKCLQYTWGGHREGSFNQFDTEGECLKACLPIEAPKPVKNYNVVAGQCICRCPKWDIEPEIQVPFMIPVTSEASVASFKPIVLKETVAEESVPEEPVTEVPATTKSNTKSSFWSRLIG